MASSDKPTTTPTQQQQQADPKKMDQALEKPIPPENRIVKGGDGSDNSERLEK